MSDVTKEVWSDFEDSQTKLCLRMRTFCKTHFSMEEPKFLLRHKPTLLFKWCAWSTACALCIVQIATSVLNFILKKCYLQICYLISKTSVLVPFFLTLPIPNRLISHSHLWLSSNLITWWRFCYEFSKWMANSVDSDQTAPWEHSQYHCIEVLSFKDLLIQFLPWYRTNVITFFVYTYPYLFCNFVPIRTCNKRCRYLKQDIIQSILLHVLGSFLLKQSSEMAISIRHSLNLMAFHCNKHKRSRLSTYKDEDISYYFSPLCHKSGRLLFLNYC